MINKVLAVIILIILFGSGILCMATNIGIVKAFVFALGAIVVSGLVAWSVSVLCD